MHDILHLLRIQAAPMRVYQALTTEAGIHGWWTREAELDSRTGLAGFNAAFRAGFGAGFEGGSGGGRSAGLIIVGRFATSGTPSVSGPRSASSRASARYVSAPFDVGSYNVIG